MAAEEQRCAYDGCAQPAAGRCRRCHATSYCSYLHQRADWQRGHAAACGGDATPTRARGLIRPMLNAEERLGELPIFLLLYTDTVMIRYTDGREVPTRFGVALVRRSDIMYLGADAEYATADDVPEAALQPYVWADTRDVVDNSVNIASDVPPDLLAVRQAKAQTADVRLINDAERAVFEPIARAWAERVERVDIAADGDARIAMVADEMRRWRAAHVAVLVRSENRQRVACNAALDEEQVLSVGLWKLHEPPLVVGERTQRGAWDVYSLLWTLLIDRRFERLGQLVPLDASGATVGLTYDRSPLSLFYQLGEFAAAVPPPPQQQQPRPPSQQQQRPKRRAGDEEEINRAARRRQFEDAVRGSSASIADRLWAVRNVYAQYAPESGEPTQREALNEDMKQAVRAHVLAGVPADVREDIIKVYYARVLSRLLIEDGPQASRADADQAIGPLLSRATATMNE
jgi:hypothetical protein